MNYSKQLKSILVASGWSQEELARRLGVSFVTLNAWVNERSEPRKKALDAIWVLYVEILGTESIDATALEEQKRKAILLTTSAKKLVEDKDVLDKLTLHLTYNTNTIEGSTMTLSDTEEVLFNHRVLTNRTQIEQAEARNHQAALLWLLDELQKENFSIDEGLVMGLHLRLMNGILGDAGQYRQHSVRIMGAQVTVANYLKIPELVNELLLSITHERMDIISSLAYTHATFEKIHPFSDGNGRIGRLVMLAQALQAELVPPLVLKEKKRAYYKYLELAQTREEFMPLELFIAESIETANQLLFERVQANRFGYEIQ